jgi:uncharacterized phage protein gp47/JayE
MAFQKDFNELLNEILTNYRNRFPGDVTQGSVLFLKASCTASMLWGLYRQLDRAADQMFVETADRAHKERHAAEFGIPTVGMSDAAITDAVLAAKRSKLAGGNRYDYAAWAKEVTLGDESIRHAVVVELAQGEGTFDIVVVPYKNFVSNELLAKIKDVCIARRPIGSGFSTGMRVVAAEPHFPQVVITGSGANWNKEATRQAINTYIDGLAPGQTLVRSMLFAIAHEYGADTATVEEPTEDIKPPWVPKTARYVFFKSGNTLVRET